jgi:hypothetical protein
VQWIVASRERTGAMCNVRLSRALSPEAVVEVAEVARVTIMRCWEWDSRRDRPAAPSGGAAGAGCRTSGIRTPNQFHVEMLSHHRRVILFR